MCLWWQDFLTESTRRIRRPSQPPSLLFQSRESLWNGAARTWCVKVVRTSHRSFTGVRTRHWAVTPAAMRNKGYSRTGLAFVKGRLRMCGALESPRIPAARRHQHEPWPGLGDVNETAEPYREFP